MERYIGRANVCGPLNKVINNCECKIGIMK